MSDNENRVKTLNYIKIFHSWNPLDEVTRVYRKRSSTLAKFASISIYNASIFAINRIF